MAPMAKNIFFLGKGGVGKSTSSALTALHLSQQGFNTRLVSMDPAHNQSDIFNQKFSEKFAKINENLAVKEVEINKWVQTYLKDMQSQVKKTYSYLTAFNLESYLDILKFSPGIEEYALLLAYQAIRNEEANADYIIFDMPPTALTLKFLTLPDISLTCLENLLKLRLKILEKKEIISRVKLGKKEIETDKIKRKLLQQIETYRQLQKIFRNPNQTLLNLVLNTDKLSFSESQLIVNNLKAYDMRISNIFLNKYYEGFDIKPIRQQYADYGFEILPQSDTPLLGVPKLSAYLMQIDSFISF